MARLPVVGGDQVARPAPLAQDAAGQPADRLQPVGVRVEQDQLVDDQPVLVGAQAVDQLRRVGAPAADDGHLGSHASNVTSPDDRQPGRADDRPDLASDRRSWPSTAGRRRPTSGSSPATAPSWERPAGPGPTTSSPGSTEPWTRSDAAIAVGLDAAGLDPAARPGGRHRRVLPGRRGPPGRRGAAGRGHRGPGVELGRPPPQRHPGRAPGRDPVGLGGRRGLRLRPQLRRPGPRRSRRAVPVAGRAVGRLHPRRLVARGPGPRARPPFDGTGGAARRHSARLVPAHFGLPDPEAVLDRGLHR